MKAYYQMKQLLKEVRWRARRSRTAKRWGHAQLLSVPAVFGNAMPKSGSHLIIQVLNGLPKLGPYVNPGFPPVNRSEDNRKLPPGEVLKNIQAMQPGDIGYGYVHAREPFIGVLSGAGRATVFVYRDPRDMIVSHVFYATEMHTGHGMHPYYTEVLVTNEERINAQITGVDEPGFELSSIRTKYEAYMGWHDQPAVLCLRFEDLILNRDETLGSLLDYLAGRGYTMQVSMVEAIEVLKSSIAPNKSGTFRKGKPGNWREHFTKDNISRFKDATGDLLLRLGYERDSDWK